MVKGIFIAVLLILFCFEGLSSVAYAGSAQVLPKGRSRLRLHYDHFDQINRRWDQDGDVEDFDTDFNATLNNNVFPALAAVEAGFAGAPFFMTPGSAILGQAYVDFNVYVKRYVFSFDHGVTDKLTVGIRVPYWKSRNHVKSFIDPGSATVGKSAIGAGLGAPLVPLAGGGPFGDATPLTTEDVKSILSDGLDVDGNGTTDIAGFGYKRFKSWSDEGFGDVQAGLMYQYVKTSKWRLAASLGASFPTGKVDDPDNLVDMVPDNKRTTVVQLGLYNDYTGIKKHVFDLTLRANFFLKDREKIRVLDDVNKPLVPAANLERVQRKYGDIFEVEVSDTYSPFKGFSILGLYNFNYKLPDRVSGSRGLAYGALENETRRKSHIAKIGVSYSTVPLFMEKEFPLPMSWDMTYRHRFIGDGNHSKSRYLSFGMNFFF